MPTTPATVPTLPAAPDPGDRSTFNYRAYTWSAALDPWTAAVNSAAVATNTNATEAATSATTATTKAAEAAASSSAAGAAVATATTKATEASASATAAASSASSAASVLDQFDDRYLGAKATPPALDNDGNALVTGAMYFNTTDNKMYARSALNTWISLSALESNIDYGLITGVASATNDYGSI